MARAVEGRLINVSFVTSAPALVVPLAVFTVTRSPLTVTVSATCPTSRVKSIRRLSFTWSVIPVTLALRNPGAGIRVYLVIPNRDERQCEIPGRVGEGLVVPAGVHIVQDDGDTWNDGGRAVLNHPVNSGGHLLRVGGNGNQEKGEK